MNAARFITGAVLAALVSAGCSEEKPKVLTAYDRQNQQLVALRGDKTGYRDFYDADFVILGGGMGGIAAALTICSASRSVILVEETDCIAGCFALQDTTTITENQFIESTGSSRAYKEFREGILAWYEERDLSPPEPFSNLPSIPGQPPPGVLCFETEAALDVVNAMLEKEVESGTLTVLTRHKIARVVPYEHRIASIETIDLDDHACDQVTGWMYIDATRTGNLLRLADMHYFTGLENTAETGEAHAPATADTMASQRFLYWNEFGSFAAGEGESDVMIVEPERERTSDSALPVPIMERPRRIVPLHRIVEQDIAAQFNDGPRARFFGDSVGIGYNPISFMYGGERTVIETRPFQIPYRALVPRRYTNMLAGGGTIGATFLAASAYQAPLVEWSIGEGAGAAAAFCAGHKLTTHELAEDETHFLELQEWMLRQRGIPLYWYNNVTSESDNFVEAQMKPFTDPAFRQQYSETLAYPEEVQGE